ncbi:MAG: DUF4139 domain-containing protein [Gemmataceae bacterium]|nr:DUF4139 domain-containing protein [Gemmataceae bacterium]
MQHRKWLWLTASVLGVFAVGVLGYSFLTSVGQADTTTLVGGKNGKTDPLPIKQVVLFNSGVGYFQREGEVDGNARLQLSFPTSDINDLLKSLVLQDAKGQIGTVNYDSSDPIDKILRSFALDLTNNPSFGQILNQARGERIKIFRSEKKDGATIEITGTVIGMETQKRPIGKDQAIDVEVLNLNTVTGLVAIPMEQVVSVRFLNERLENEFQRALSVLATSHDTQKKTVSVGFNGEGKRHVRVGYVVERPIWKTTYRLRIDNNNKISLQGWALVENTSDDDWNNIDMFLVSGKPISFRMNLYDPIYIPRPFVEPEMFASLRPPVYGGAMMPEDAVRMAQNSPMPSPGLGLPGQLPPATKADKAALNQFRQQNLNQITKEMQERAFRDQNKLSYEELQRRRQELVDTKGEAKKVGSAVAGFNFKEGIQSVATAADVGDYFQYTIDQKVTLPRQKSAMLPILDQSIDGLKVSIYNEATHAKYPLLGLKLKNTSKQPLTQGPITVYDGGIFGGDTRILDLQPNEERLLSYALDQGTEVKTEIKQAPSPDLIFRIGDGTLSARYYVRQTKTYTVKNRSTHDRMMVLEHPIKPDWKLFEPKKPAEQTRDLYRFMVSSPAGTTVTYEVVEDMPKVDNYPGQPSYAVANGINVKVETNVDLHKLVGLRINKGFVLATNKSRETKAYYIQNLSDMDRSFTVDHVVRPGWTRLDDKNDPIAGPEVFRFKLEIGKSKTGNKAVREERTYTETGVLLKNLNETQIKLFTNNPITSADVKAAFTKSVEMQGKIVDTQKQIAEVEKQLTIVTADHTRVRENLKVIPMSSDFYKTFLEKFVAQDKQIETFQKNVRDMNATLQGQIHAYDQWLAKLDAE